MVNFVLSPITQVPNDANALPPMVGSRFNLDAMLPLELIRQHTKTDDVPNVSDLQLSLYRKAAVESAEHYTGFLLAGVKVITEAVDLKPARHMFKRARKYFLKYPTADGIVHLYGARAGITAQTVRVTPGTKEISLPVIHTAIDMSSCCNPCGDGAVNNGMQIMYRAGFECADDIPSGVILGMLKFIAWCVNNPGDEVTGVRNRPASVESGVLQGTNNIAWASGALELWRQYDGNAI